MQPIRLLGPAIFVAGLACLGLAVARGEATASLVVIFPVVTGSGPLTLAGIVLTFLGFFATFLIWPWRRAEIVAPEGSAPAAEGSSGSSPTRRWGGVLFLGPFPIVFGSDSRITWAMLLVGVALFVALLGLTLIALLG